MSAQRRGRGPVADVALAATLHDASGSLLPMIRRWLPALAAQYRGIAVATSPPTAARVRALLAAAGVHAGSPASNTRGPLYRLALRRARATGAAHIHYLDFDRALHWIAHAPRELAALVRTARRQRALLVGRTVAAHATHQRPLVATETDANDAFARRLGVAGRLDFLVPSFVLDRDATTRLLTRSRARGATMYGEWAALVAGLVSPLAYVECRGLDWETPDRHPRAVARVGLAVWRRRMESAAEWELRRAMGADFARGFVRTLARWPVGALRVRRLRGYM